MLKIKQHLVDILLNFSNLFTAHLLNIYYVLSTLPGTGTTLVNMIEKNAYLLGMVYSLVEKINKQIWEISNMLYEDKIYG